MKNKLFESLKVNWGLIAIVILSVFLAFYRLATQSFGFDESFSIYISRDWSTMLGNLWNHETNMWLYYSILHFWQVFGTTEFAVRTLSVFFAIATIPVIYLLGNYVYNKRVALIASLLTVINVIYVLYAQETRSYSLVLFLVSLSSYSFLRYEENQKYKAIFIVSSALSIYSHFYGGFVLLAQIFTALFRKKFRLFIPALFAVFLLVIPLILAPSIHSHQIDWMDAPSWQALIGTALFLSGDFLPLFVIYSILFITMLPFLRKHYREEKYKYLLSWLIVPVGFSFVFSLFFKPIYQSMYFIICLPPLMILIAIAIENLKAKLLKNAILATVCVLSAVRLFLWYTEDTSYKLIITNEKYDWRSAIKYISSNGENADAVIVYPYQDKLLYSAYNPEGKLKVVEISSTPYLISGGKKLPEPNTTNILSLRYPHIWLLLHVVTDEDFDHNKRQADEITNALSKNYTIDGTKEYFGIDLVHFNKK